MKLNLNIPLQSLSTKELDILQYVHDHSDNISSISIQQFANELNYSTSTILRFCRKLGFSGFSEFKYFLKSSDNEDNNKVKGSDKSLDIIKNTIKDSMDSTLSLLNSDDMFQIARLFQKTVLSTCTVLPDLQTLQSAIWKACFFYQAARKYTKPLLPRPHTTLYRPWIREMFLFL